MRPNVRAILGKRQIRQSPGLALNAHSGNEWGKIPVLSGTALEVGDLGALAGPYKTDVERRTDPGALPFRGAAATPSSGVPDMNSTALVKMFESVREDDHVPEIEINKNSDLIEFFRPRGRISTPPDTEENFSRPNAPSIFSSERARGSNQLLSFSHQRATPSDHRLGQIATHT